MKKINTKEIREMVNKDPSNSSGMYHGGTVMNLCNRIDILEHENQLLMQSLLKIINYEVEEGEWCETAEAFFWFAKHCISELEDRK